MKKCFVCGHDKISRGITNKMFEDRGHLIIIKEIPSLICENCGEIYFETDTMLSIEKIINRSISELEIVVFSRAA